jgi:predicted phage terminase large subunit-like protein
VKDEPAPLIIGPQPGPQTMLMECKADVAIYGGAAGGAKTYGILLDAAQWPVQEYHGYEAVIFRRTYPQIMNPGGLWDTSMKFYGDLGGCPSVGRLEWAWHYGAGKPSSKVKFAQLHMDGTVEEWKGSQMAFVGFDELCDFTKRQFIYMLSRLRSTCGVQPYLRATCNPDMASWVKKLIAWWLDKNGFPIAERAGVMRWFKVTGDDFIWSDAPKPGYLSFTFIPSKVTDNKILLDADPTYMDRMNNLLPYERATLLEGSWNVARSAGMTFRRSKFNIIPAVPTDVVRWIRWWDRAATQPAEGTDPDWTVGVKMGLRRTGRLVVAHVERFQGLPDEVDACIKRMSKQDGIDCEIGLFQDPGSAGVKELQDMTRQLAGRIIVSTVQTGSKHTRAKPYASQVNVGNVDLVEGVWNDDYLNEHESFVDEKQVKPPPGYHDDQVDPSGAACSELVNPETVPTQIHNMDN